MAKRICDTKDLSGDSLEISYILNDLCYSTDEKTCIIKAENLWKKLSFNKNGFHYVKVKAILTKSINILFEVKPGIDSKTNQSNAFYHDIALMMFNLLKEDYYCLERNVKHENLSLYRRRIEIYLNKNVFARHAFEHFNYSKRPTRVIASVANSLSLYSEEDIKIFLKEALKEYTIINNSGVRILKPQEPCLTLENFPSLAQTEPSDKNGHQSHKNLTGAIILKGESYGITPITAGQFEDIVKENIKKEDMPLPLGEEYGRLSFIKPSINLSDMVSFTHKAGKIFNFVRIHARSIWVVLSMVICTIFQGHRPMLFTDSLNVARNVGISNVVNPDFTVETKVRTVWCDGTELKIGDKVEFQINYKNTSDFKHDDVIIDDQLPANLKYIPGTTKLYNGKYTSGMLVDSNAVTGTGIIIGNYTAGANALVRFQAEVVDDNFTCGKFILRNWGRASVGTSVIQDSIDVNVQLAYCSDPEQPNPVDAKL